ncbi:MAG TPA: hypothetical protein VGJ59_21730 [Jatrophihabitantaceae bacterium]
MTARKRKPVVTVDIGRWTVELAGPVRWTVPVARRVCGRSWTFEPHARTVRIKVEHTADIVAALEAAKRPHVVNGAIPEPTLWGAP